ncbi:hypothetical protein [Spiroplasma turonicum]|uniref:Lipoprotein n=1 Tax=Spiroplasma turonicum TaxID=216946 RepID=A0A0K1P6Z6_9MOLU|nr:hypothetical protein [Spiroplasma turonicum]AKU79657.1 hypothetical protein STURON_00411 [Spiroplasma turonicum]ALX70677.1 hypothetical protein STURO_v1c04090 [Spiroplasma turonicum]
MKKLLGILTTMFLSIQPITLITSCGSNDNSHDATTENDKIFQIDDQKVYENHKKIIIVNIKNPIKNAEIKVINSNSEDKVYVDQNILNDENETGKFELTIYGKKRSLENTIQVKYGDLQCSFKINVLESNSSTPRFEENINYQVSLNKETPLIVHFANPIKNAKYSFIPVDSSVVNVLSGNGIDSDTKSSIEFKVKGLNIGKTRILLNYENVQCVLNIEVKEISSDEPSFNLENLKVTKNKSLTREINVTNPIKGAKINISKDDNESLINSLSTSKTNDEEGNGSFLIYVKANDKVGNCVLNITYGNIVKKISLTVQDNPIIKADENQEQSVMVGMHLNNFKLSVENPYQFAPIKVEVSEQDKKYVDAFSMQDYDMEETGKITLVVYGLEIKKQIPVKVYYDESFIELKFDIVENPNKKPEIFGSPKEINDLNTNQSLSVGVYINNPTLEGILTTDFENNKFINIQISGNKGAGYYTIFFITNSNRSDEIFNVTLNYENAEPVTIKVSFKK